MDLVYSVGPDNGSDWYNLRMSLRSVDAFADNVGKVIVAGEPPPWLSNDVVRFEHPKDYKLGKQWNILNTILAVIDAGLVKGEFLYSSDDHFLVHPVNFNRYPYYYKREAMRSFEDVVSEESISGWTGYNKCLGLTRALLEDNGYGYVQYNGHVNTHFDTADAPVVKQLIDSRDRPNVGYEPTCLFMNVREKRKKVRKTFREDCKLIDFSDTDKIIQAMGERDTFSVCDECDLGENFGRYKSFMDAMYGDKSRFEK